MVPASRGHVSAITLSLLLVLAGCAGAGGPIDGAGTSPNATATAPSTTSPTTGEPPEPPFDLTNQTELFVRVLGETNQRLRGANFTYERVRRTRPPGADHWSEYNETMWIGRNGSIRWVTRSGPIVYDNYRPGTGLQFGRAHDPRTGQTEYSIHEHTDDLFVEEQRLGPLEALSPVPFYWPNTSEFTYRGIERWEDEDLHVYHLDNASRGITLNVTLYVTDGGFVRHARGRATVEREDGTTVHAVRETYTAVNETTVEPPDWLDEARAAESG